MRLYRAVVVLTPIGCRYTAPASGDLDTITVVSTGANTTHANGSPVRIALSSHNLSAPYVRCDSRRGPRFVVAVGKPIFCRLYGLPLASDLADFAASVLDPATGAVSRLDFEDSVGRTATFTLIAASGAENATASVIVSSARAVVSGSPVTIHVGGVLEALPSTLECSAQRQPLHGYMVRGDVVTCTIHAVASGTPVFSSFDDFVVTTSFQAVAGSMHSADGGRSVHFQVRAPTSESVFSVEIGVALANGPDAGISIRNSPFQLLLTDVSPPSWVASPVVTTVEKTTVAVEVTPSEPAIVYVCWPCRH